MDQELPKGYRGTNYPAGKGDKPRPKDGNKYRSNYDQIDWGRKPQAEKVANPESKEPK